MAVAGVSPSPQPSPARGEGASSSPQIKGSGVGGRGSGTGPDREALKLKEACRDFEAIFLNYVLKSMRKTVAKTDLFGSSRDEEVFQEMLDTEVCKAASKTGSMGIGDMLYRELGGAGGVSGTRSRNGGEVSGTSSRNTGDGGEQ